MRVKKHLLFARKIEPGGGFIALWRGTEEAAWPYGAEEAAQDYGGEPRRCHCPLEGNWGDYMGLGRKPYGVEHRMFHVGWDCHIKPKQHCAFLNSSELKEQSRRNVCPWAPEQIRSGWVPTGWCFLQRVGQRVSLSLWVMSNAKHF